MTPEQKEKLKRYGIEIKKMLIDFTGSISYHFSREKKDVKFDVKESDVAKES